MVSEHHMRQALSRYLSGEVSLAEFQEWFVPRAWEALGEGGPAADIAGHIELLLAEFTGGYQDEIELRLALKNYADAPMVLLREPDQKFAIYWSTSSVGAEISNNTVAFGSSILVQAPRIQFSEEKSIAA
jgi:hypothetical protein